MKFLKFLNVLIPTSKATDYPDERKRSKKNLKEDIILKDPKEMAAPSSFPDLLLWFLRITISQAASCRAFTVHCPWGGCRHTDRDRQRKRKRERT